MDYVNKLTTGDKVLSGGALAVLIGMFLPWFKVDIGGFGGGSVNGFHYFLQGTFPFRLFIALVALIAVIRFSPETKLPDNPVGWSMTIIIVAAVAGLLILTRIISTDGPSQYVSRGIGLYLSFLGAIAVIVGAFLKFQAKEDDAPGTAGGGTAPPTSF